MFLFMMLDLNQVFSYVQTSENPYYGEAANHHEFYIQLLQSFARYHTLKKLQAVYFGAQSQVETSSIMIDTVMEEEYR